MFSLVDFSLNHLDRRKCCLAGTTPMVPLFCEHLKSGSFRGAEVLPEMHLMVVAIS